MAIIGQQLLQPEAGWKRYSHLNNLIFKKNLIDKPDTIPRVAINKPAGEFGVRFFGKFTGFLWYGYTGPQKDWRQIIVKVDGQIIDTQIAYGMPNTSVCIIVEGLIDEYHSIEIYGTQISSEYSLTLQYIDIQNGYLLHPDEVTNIKELVPGKRIRCHYQAIANSVGLFSNLGKEVYVDGINDFIPVTGSATPNGCFYFICVGYDENGKTKLVADRNIQHSISWSKINEAGFIYGKDVYFANIKNTIVRSLSGGKSSIDKNNEWDKIIVENNLNNTITPGDNNVWNWRPIASWTTTTGTSAMADRVQRGGTALTDRIVKELWVAVSNTGFRPVLIIDNAKNINFIIKNKDKFYTIKDSTIKETDKKNKNDYMNTNNLFNTIKKAEHNHLKNNDIFKNKINKKLNKKINIK